ncbi:HipA domain-containing protein [Mesorhizobium caraganae]|uniref:HipA domain-containing protein n=2 Tax=Mesorhizobium caraganae TaxID=483206 RepID=A0ABV1Z6X1_9HYPH
MKNTGKGDGLTLPLNDEQGRYIAKFPSTAFPGVSESEFANLALAAAIGMEVPECELVEKSDFEGVPEEFNTLSEGKVLLVKRFDRGANGERIHIGFRAGLRCLSRKYEGAAYHDIALALAVAVSPTAALDFVRRLALTVITGHGDMHLKNWSLIYPGNGDKPALAPTYDLLSTVPYIPANAMALSLGGERSFKAQSAPRWKAFANRARLPEPAVLKAVVETVKLSTSTGGICLSATLSQRKCSSGSMNM